MTCAHVKGWVIVLSLGIAATSFGQSPYLDGEPSEWQFTVVGGYFTGGSIVSTTVNGEQANVKTDDGWLTGVRFGQDNEYLGWELTAAAVFADLDVKIDPAALVSIGNDSSWLLANLNAMYYPTGMEMADGRIRPFVTAGPGLAHFNSDFDQADNETMFALNVGGGVKFLLGDTGDLILRLDWRWHHIVGSTAGLNNSIYRQEISMGLAWRF